MKKGSWTLRFQRSDIKRTNSWLADCHTRVKSSCGRFRACGVMFCRFAVLGGGGHFGLISLSQCYFQNGGDHVRGLVQKAGTGCQRSYLLVDGWEQAMRDGHILWPSARGVMLVIQIGHRCPVITWASMQIFGWVTKCLVPMFMERHLDSDMPAFCTNWFVFIMEKQNFSANLIFQWFHFHVISWNFNVFRNLWT